MTTQNPTATCGRCGAYRHLHPTSWCAKSRYSYWWDRHNLIPHVVVPIWWRLPKRTQWAVVEFLADHPYTRCWCDLVDCVMRAEPQWRNDYTGDNGCACDFQLPWQVKRPHGDCYCPPERGDA